MPITIGFYTVMYENKTYREINTIHVKSSKGHMRTTKMSWKFQRQSNCFLGNQGRFHGGHLNGTLKDGHYFHKEK